MKCVVKRVDMILISSADYGAAEQLAERVRTEQESDTSAASIKPDSLQSIYVRPEGRTLQKLEFFASCKVVP
jgi:hypothetical protein